MTNIKKRKELSPGKMLPMLCLCLLWLIIPACSNSDSEKCTCNDVLGCAEADASGDSLPIADLAPSPDSGQSLDVGTDMPQDSAADAGVDAVSDAGTVPITLQLVEGCNLFATSDECLLPLPSAFYQAVDPTSPTGFRVAIPQEGLPVEPDSPSINLEPINTADGCSPAGPLLLHFGVDIDPTQLTRQVELLESLATDNPIALFDLETGDRVMFMSEMDMNRVEGGDGRYALIIRPMEPMEMGHRHVAVLTRDLRDDAGGDLSTPAAFAALRDGVATTNSEIEEIREQYEEIFTFLSAKGYPRDNLLLAWDFMVASEDYLTGSVRAMREEAWPEIDGTGLGYTIDSIEDDPVPNAARVVKGTFVVPNFLNEESAFEYDADHHPIRQPDKSFPFALLIPKRSQVNAESLPLVVFGHGLFGTGQGSFSGGGLGVMAKLCEEGGAVMVATDWIGLSGGDLQLILTEVIPDLNRIALVTDRLQQSIINNITLTELAAGTLSTDPQVMVSEVPVIDESRIYYVGGSLGGIQGSSFVAMSPRVTRAVLAVPGAGWLNMLTRSIHWNKLAPVIDFNYPDPLLKQIGIALIQALFDLSDPVNLTVHLYKSPLDDAPAERVLLLHEAIGDSQVPNMASEMLARAIGASIMEPSAYHVPGLPPVTSPALVPAVLVQVNMPDLVETAPPPESNVPPQGENNVHGAISFLDHIMGDTFHFLNTGEAQQSCTGVCDPD